MRLIDVDELLDDLIFPTEQFKRAFTEMMNDCPTVEAEPTKHGRWKVLHGVLAGDDIYGDMGECSNCGLHLRNYEWNYCPNCGARMDEVEEQC